MSHQKREVITNFEVQVLSIKYLELSIKTLLIKTFENETKSNCVFSGVARGTI